MYSAGDLKTGINFIYNDEPCKVLDYKHTHMGRRGADITVKMKGLISGNILQITLSPSDKFKEGDLDKIKMQYLYSEGQTLFFMNPKSFEQVEISAKKMDNDIDFLHEGENYNVFFWEEKALSIEIPPKVVMEIIECDPGVKGNSAANMYKSAMLIGGIKVKVPLFINKGEKIRVDTINRKYVERAK
jgi:elongation factor P